jgi:hypothetical protein
MDENVQHKIILACIALLQKNSADYQQARKRTGLRGPTTKREAIEFLLSAASEPDITLENVRTHSGSSLRGVSQRRRQGNG